MASLTCKPYLSEIIVEENTPWGTDEGVTTAVVHADYVLGTVLTQVQSQVCLPSGD